MALNKFTSQRSKIRRFLTATIVTSSTPTTISSTSRLARTTRTRTRLLTKFSTTRTRPCVILQPFRSNVWWCPGATSSSLVKWMSSSRAAGTGQVKPFLLADIGEGIAEVEIVKWMVETGQSVMEFDPILEVQSDKAAVEITSPFQGKIVARFGQVGDSIKVGSQLCLVEVEPDNQVVSTAPSSESPLDEGQDHIATRFEDEVVTLSSSPSSSPSLQQQGEAKGQEKQLVHSTPAVRRLAKDHQVDISTVRATGKGGRVTKEDVIAHLQASSSSPLASTTASPAPSSPASALTSPAAATTTTPIQLSSTKKAMFKSMTMSLQIPHFSYCDEIDVTEVERIRRHLNSSIPDRLRKSPSAQDDEVDSGGDTMSTGRVDAAGRIDRVTMLSFMVKALGWAMTQHRLFQCTLQNDGLLHQRPGCDISIALSTRSGLFTPLVPDVQNMTVYDVASWIARLQDAASKATEGQIPKFPGPCRSGTMTLSNVGIIGGTYTHPVIPPSGQLAIGAIGQMRVVPRYRPEFIEAAKKVAVMADTAPSTATMAVEPRLVVSASFSADHRVVEGVALAQLVATWKTLLEQPQQWVGLAR